MSSVVRGLMARMGPFAAMAACVWTAPAGAQSTEDQETRVRALEARQHTLVDRLVRLQRMDDTIYVGGIGFVVKAADTAEAREAARLAVDRLAQVFDPIDRRLLDGWITYVLRGGWAGEAGRARAVENIVPAAGEHRLPSLSGMQLRTWTRWWAPEPIDLTRAYLDLVTVPATVATACFEGTTSSCARVLGLQTVADPWTELLSPQDRRVWVASRLRSSGGPGGRGADHADAVRRCVDQREDEACLAILRTAWDDFPHLVSARTLRSVLLVARQLGGDGTFARLLADTTAPLGPRLATAAGVPLDSLLRTWHGAVLAAAPPATRVSSPTGWMSLFAVVVLCGLSLRSTRWR